MKLFALASSILATPAVIVSAAAVAQADGQLTATYDNLKDGVYTTELVDGTKVYRSVGRRSLQTLPGQSTNGILERRGKLPFLTHCGTAENDRRMDPTEMNNAMNEMLATLNTPYTLTRLSLVVSRMPSYDLPRFPRIISSADMLLTSRPKPAASEFFAAISMGKKRHTSPRNCLRRP